MTYGFNMGMVIRWDKKIHKEIMPCLTTGSGDNAPHIIIISEDNDELRIRPSLVQSGEERTI